jgi:hypothetical protein
MRRFAHLLDYGGRVEKDITGLSAEEIKKELEKLVGLGMNCIPGVVYFRKLFAPLRH